jgi:hypothetical protein
MKSWDSWSVRDLGNRWRWVVSLLPLMLCPLIKKSRNGLRWAWGWLGLTHGLDAAEEVFTAPVMYIAIFWNIAPCSRIILPSHLLHAGFLLCLFSILKMEVIRSAESSAHTRTTRRYIGILCPWQESKVIPNLPSMEQISQTAQGRLIMDINVAWRMPSSGMQRRVALVRTDVSEGRIASMIRVTSIGYLGTTLTLTSDRSTPILVTIIMEAIRSSESFVFTGATRRNIPEDGILHSSRRDTPQILQSNVV